VLTPSTLQASGSLRSGRTVSALFALFCVSLVPCTSTLGQQIQTPPTDAKKLYRIEVEDADEAALIEQELKLKPALVRSRSFYYYGDEQINRRLAEFEYHPSAVDPDEIFTRAVRVAEKADETSVDLNRRRDFLLRDVSRQTVRSLAS
jgi:bisphosphoglycerate-dependent phosphoglycerate mutase